MFFWCVFLHAALSSGWVFSSGYYKEASTVWRTRACFFWGGFFLFLSSPACSCFLRYAVVAFDLLYLLLSFMLSWIVIGFLLPYLGASFRVSVFFLFSLLLFFFSPGSPWALISEAVCFLLSEMTIQKGARSWHVFLGFWGKEWEERLQVGFCALVMICSSNLKNKCRGNSVSW